MTRPPLDRPRMERLVRIYHTAADAEAATGHNRNSLRRAARKHGLRFRGHNASLSRKGTA